MAGLALIFCVSMLCPRPVATRQVPSLSLAPTDISVSVNDANLFSNNEIGLYLTRPENPNPENVYSGTISTEELIADAESDGKTGFQPKYTALKRQNDQWSEMTDQDVFWYDEEDSTKYSVRWKLRETAPAMVYGIRCSYTKIIDGYEQIVSMEFQILYTEDWTYIKVANNAGARRITNFAGGQNMTLTLNVTFNDGAADPNLFETDNPPLSSGAKYDRLVTGNVVSTETMDITVKTVSGGVYKNFVTKIDDNIKNRVDIRFEDKLSNEIYLVQFTSKADSRIIGQFIIDNSGMRNGVNLSQLWVILMIFGGLVALAAASAYFVPLIIVKVNETRVYKENERIARMKNPEAYAVKKKKSVKETLDKLIYNIKTPAYKRKKDAAAEEKPAEEKVYTNRFTEMLRERQEKRDFMREHNVTSVEMEKIKEAEAAAAADEANSFAALRDDDDDEIATFHAAEDEISTLETGSYVQDGTTFAKLDSMRDENGNGDDGNY